MENLFGEKMAKEGENRLLILLGYIIWIIAAVLYFARKKELSALEKYHYIQASLLGVAGLILSFIPILGIVSIILWLYAIYLGIKVYQGEDPRPLKQYVEQINL